MVEINVSYEGGLRCRAVHGPSHTEVLTDAPADNMGKGHASPEVQEQVANWRDWLENFHYYSDEAVLGLGQMYSQDPRFAEFFAKYGDDLPAFLTKAIEHYCANRK